MAVPSDPVAMPQPVSASRASVMKWDGRESGWTSAARAAAPWMLWSLVLWLGVPGGAELSRVVQGPFALALVLVSMVVFAHRLELAKIARFVPAILGTGLMAELLANAVTDMGRRAGLAATSDLVRGLVVWLICVAVYEVAVIVAVNSRIGASDKRRPALDLGAHALFLALALAAYWHHPRAGAWWISPWTATALALPFAAARCGAVRPAELPLPSARGRALVGLAFVLWLLAATVAASKGRELGWTLATLARRGLSPADGALLALPLLSLLLSLLAAGTLLVRGLAARRALSGRVASGDECGLTLERAAPDEPALVALESSVGPATGEVVTLFGVRPKRPDAGPFRDGAPRLVATGFYAGTPSALRAALMQRAAGWLAWAAVGALGVLARLL